MGFLRLAGKLLLALALGMLLLCPNAADAGDKRFSATRDQLRSLFVQRLVKYVQWPGREGEPLSDPVVVAATDSARLRPFFKNNDRFKLVQWPVDNCHVLVLNHIPERSVAAITRRVAGDPILTIGQGVSATRLGAIVSLVQVGSRLKLEVNLSAAKKAGLSISSRLLKLARVHRDSGDE